MWIVYASANPSTTSPVLGQEFTLPSSALRAMPHASSVEVLLSEPTSGSRTRAKLSLIHPAPQDKDGELKFSSYDSVMPETEIKHISELVQLVSWENTTGYISSCNTLSYKHRLSLPPSR